MTENNIDDLRKARYMSLSCPPASPEAKSLVEDIIDIIAKSEKRQRARKADEVPVFRVCGGSDKRSIRGADTAPQNRARVGRHAKWTEDCND